MFKHHTSFNANYSLAIVFKPYLNINCTCGVLKPQFTLALHVIFCIENGIWRYYMLTDWCRRSWTMVELCGLKLSVSIRIVKLSSPSTVPKSALAPKCDGRRLPSLSSKLVSSDLKRTNRSLHRISLIVPSLKSSWLGNPSFLRMVQHSVIIDMHFYNLKAEG